MVVKLNQPSTAVLQLEIGKCVYLVDGIVEHGLVEIHGAQLNPAINVAAASSRAELTLKLKPTDIIFGVLQQQ